VLSAGERERDVIDIRARSRRPAIVSNLPAVVHVLPHDGTGGAEVAARSLPEGRHSSVSVHKLFIARRSADGAAPFLHEGPLRSESHPVNYAWAINRVLALQPDLLVGSLWRSCLVLLAVKLIRPRTRLVVFLHSSRSVHALDHVVTTAVMRLAYEVWADSASTLAGRVPASFRGRTRVLSFQTARATAGRACEGRSSGVAAAFIFWGRLHPHKQLSRAVRLFALLHRRLRTATYTIIGPDGGERAGLEALCHELGIAPAVHFLGPMTHAEIRAEAASHSFYLQTSVLEGMAMSVVEAMQLGLVPVVTPVGEIARYCRDGENAVLVTDDDAAVVRRVEHLLTHPDEYARLSATAAAAWQSAPLYRDDFLAACEELIGRPCAA
jgi:glycosyltransferase involved in cell wall biosynthesis